MDMGMNVNSIRSMTSRYLSTQQDKTSRSFNKLAAGLRIARASDDASGLGISERMRSQIRSYDVASRNTRDGIEMVETAESALGEASSALGRMRELTVQASNGTLSDTDRHSIQNEYQQLAEHLNFLGQSTQYNGQKLLDGSLASMDVQTGTDSGDTTAVILTEISEIALGLSAVDLSSVAGAGSAMEVLDVAIEEVSSASGELGAQVNTLGSQHRSLVRSSGQLRTSESRIRDVDMAMETAVLTQQHIVAQGSISLLSHSALNSTRAKHLL
jgi:flagellin